MEKKLRTAPATAASPQLVPRCKGKTTPVHPGSLPVETVVTNLDFDVTENCNLGCLYCFKGEMYAKHMPLETMQRAFDWLLAASGGAPEVNCNFMGGEPTMRFKQIKAFVPWAIRRARGRGKRVTFSMTTNLTLFTDEIRAFVDQYNFGVLMSVDGSPEVQDAQRPAKNGKPVSAVVEKWARSMLRTRPRCQARATLHPDHVGRVFESFRYLHSLGFHEVVFSAAEYDGWTDKHFQVFQQQLSECVDYVVGVFSEGGEVNIAAWKYYINKLIRYRASGREEEIEFMPQPCGAGKGYMMVDYTGDIWPCHRFDGADTDSGANGQFRLGNIFSGGFNHEIQRGFVDFDHRREHKTSCESCPINPVCGGFCPAANLSSTGSIYSPHDAYCRYSQLMYDAAVRLFERFADLGTHALTALLDQCSSTHASGEK